MKKSPDKRSLTKLAKRFFATWRLFAEQRSKLIALAAVVVVPTSFLRTYGTLSTDLSVLITAASLYCVLALIYFCHHLAQAQKQTVARIYTEASGRFLQILGVTIGLSIALTPVILSLGLLLLIGSFSLPVWLYPPTVLLAIVFIGVFTGVSQAQLIVTCEKVSVFGAFKASWQRTKGLRSRIATQSILFMGFLVAVISTLFFVVNLSSLLAESWFAQGLVGGLVITPALAWFIVFGYSIYDELSR